MFIKPFLSSRDKRIISIIIPLQVLANIGSFFVSETAIGSMNWSFWVSLAFMLLGYMAKAPFDSSCNREIWFQLQTLLRAVSCFGLYCKPVSTWIKAQKLMEKVQFMVFHSYDNDWWCQSYLFSYTLQNLMFWWSINFGPPFISLHWFTCMWPAFLSASCKLLFPTAISTG